MHLIKVPAFVDIHVYIYVPMFVTFNFRMDGQLMKCSKQIKKSLESLLPTVKPWSNIREYSLVPSIIIIVLGTCVQSLIKLSLDYRKRELLGFFFLITKIPGAS